VGDFDGDLHDDLIVGVPREDDENLPFVLSDLVRSAGAANVIHGSPTGLKTTLQEYARVWWQDSDGIKGHNEDDDDFGSAVAGGDFDGDGFDDVAIGVPGEDRNGIVDDGGVVNVIYGTSDGLDDVDDDLVHQNTSGQWVENAIPIAGYMQEDDLLGCDIAIGRIDADAYDDLLVSVRDGSDIGFNILRGEFSGLSPVGDSVWHCAGFAGCTPQWEFLNFPSAHSPVTDGVYTDPPGTGEWSDVVPLAFAIGPQGPVAVNPTDTGSVDSAFLAALGPEPDPEVAHLNLHFDLVLRTDTAVSWQDPLATIRFRAQVPGLPEPTTIGVHLHGNGPGLPAMPPAAWLDLDGDGYPDDTSGGSEPNVPASVLGIEASAGFAPSPFESTPHLQVELKLPLEIPAGFPDPAGPLAAVPDGPGGVYLPDPGLWTVEYRANAPGYEWLLGAPALLEIHPGGEVQGSFLDFDRIVDIVLLDGLDDGNGHLEIGIPSVPGFDASILFTPIAANASDPSRTASFTAATTIDIDGDDTLDMVLQFSGETLLANGVLTEHRNDLLLTANHATGPVAGVVMDLTLPRASWVPDGGSQYPGTPLTIQKKNNPSKLNLFWGDSCIAGGADYAIYEGTLGAPNSHESLLCSTSGVTSSTVFVGEGDRYYLVVPLSPDGVEGSHGVTSSGAQRPPGISSCMAQLVTDSCVP
jgi:hypothetical protein